MSAFESEVRALPPEPETPAQLHISRNPRLTRVLAELSIMREQGEGIPRMFEEMEQSWLPMPELTVDAHSFTLTLRNTPIFDSGNPEWVRYVRSLPISNRQRRILIAYPNGRFASADYQRLNQVDRDLAYRELRELVEQGFLEGPEHPGRGAHYRVLVATPESRASSPRQALARVMREKGQVQNSDFRACFASSREVAKAQLALLVENRVLRRQGEGRSAHYVPGSSWQQRVEGAQ
ncbi:MAG: hypothetical protein HYW07_10255 [Candidatus Latescibacteria bacterium]|nr:hypothetical protein [Candidatus Latescibacterota bacterium]